jgi:hypothetical protein
MSAAKFVSGGYEIDPTPEVLPAGLCVARAVLTRQVDGKVEEIWPDFEPFATEVEATNAAHIAAVAWISHR